VGPTGVRAVVEAFGETPLDAVERQLRLEAQAPPDPAELGASDVIVAVQSAQVGWVDLLMASGQYQHMAAPPYTPGLEYAGEVVWSGPAAAARWPVGARVIADGLMTGPRSLGPYQRWGGFASYAVAPAAALRSLPDGWSYDQGACLLGSYETAYHCLVARGGVTAGETVLIHGASGATGLAAVHIAKRLGATVIATGRSTEKLLAVRDNGADHVIRTASDADGELTPFRAEVKALTGGRGVDVVYDGVGGPISVESLRCVRFGARYLIVGWAATPLVAKGAGGRGAPNANVLPTNLIMMKGLDVLGCPTAISTHLDPSIRAARLAAIDGWISAGLAPHVGAVYDLADLKRALRDKWKSRFVGGGVVRPPARG
jgi:NADPH2:quinone reductase